MLITNNNSKYIIALSIAFAAALLCGCVSPGGMDPSVIARYQRTMARLGPHRRITDGLGSYRPQTATRPPLKIVTDDETGRSKVFLSLDEAIMRTLANSLDIRVVSFDPAISREEMVKAASEFDYVVFGGLNIVRSDEQTAITTTFGGGKAYSRVWEAGVRQKTVTGAVWELKRSLEHNFDSSSARSMHRSYDDRISLEITQPLLRNAWPQFNLAKLRVARLNHQVSMAEFRRNVEETVTEVIVTYWALIQTRRDRLIQQELLDRTIETYERIKKRELVDATKVEIKQAEAAVEIRRAGLILAKNAIGDVEDRMARLLADSQLNILSDYEIAPTTRPNVEQIHFDETDQLLTALRFNPLLEQARLAIEMAGINVRVAENEILPRLDLTGSVTNQGLGPTANEARKHRETVEFTSYSIGFQFEYPIGNRERAGSLRQRKAERLKAITAMQNATDQMAVQIRERIRQIQTAYEEMKAQRRAVEASREQLEAIIATEELRQLTPEFLQVKLVAQGTLANAERDELRAIVEYNNAIADLARVTGTTLELHRVQIALPTVLGAEDTYP